MTKYISSGNLPQAFTRAREMSEVFNDIFDIGEPVSKLPSKIVTSTYPPADMYVEKDSGNLVFEFAVAGYQESEVGLSFEEDYLILTLSAHEAEDTDNRDYFQKGIKRSKSETRCFVPASKYDVRKVEASINKGILKVSIPAREESKPFSIKIKN